MRYFVAELTSLESDQRNRDEWCDESVFDRSRGSFVAKDILPIPDASKVRAGAMIRGGFLSEYDRKVLIPLARDGSTACRVTRRADALVRLDDGKSCQRVGEWLPLDDDTVRGWHALFGQSGIEGLSAFDVGGSSGRMNAEQAEALKASVNATFPCATRHIGGWIAKEFCLVSESRSGLIALMHRLGLEYRKPHLISRRLDEEKQKTQIAKYEDVLNSEGDDEVVASLDAVHPTHATRPAGCWRHKEQQPAIEQTSRRERMNIPQRDRSGNRQTQMFEVETVDASTITLLESLELLYPLPVCIHVVLYKASHHPPNW